MNNTFTLTRLETRKNALGTTRVVTTPDDGALQPGEVLMKIDRFALTTKVRDVLPEFTERAARVPGLPRAHGLLRIEHPEAGALRIPLEHLGARVYPDMFSLAQAHRKQL